MYAILRFVCYTIGVMIGTHINFILESSFGIVFLELPPELQLYWSWRFQNIWFSESRVGVLPTHLFWQKTCIHISFAIWTIVRILKEIEKVWFVLSSFFTHPFQDSSNVSLKLYIIFTCRGTTIRTWKRIFSFIVRLCAYE